MSKTTEEILLESAAMDLEMKKVQLELQREQLADINDRKEARRAVISSQQRDLAENERQKAMREAACKHKKGGRNRAGLDRGTDSNYAVIQHTMPVGDVMVMCQRCGAIWMPPPAALKRSDPEAYTIAARNYRKALEWPTDNEPSGTQLFLIQRTQVRAFDPDEDEYDYDQATPTRVRKSRTVGKKKAAA